VSHRRYPVVAVRRGFHPAHAAVRHPDTPLTVVSAVIRHVHAVHHVPLVAVDVLIAQAAGVVHLRHRCAAVFVHAPVPGKLVHAIVHDAVRNAAVHAGRLFVPDGVPHTAACRAARRAVIRVLSRTTLLLRVPAPIEGEEQVRDARVHQRVYLLHTPLYRVVMEVRPCHARRRATTSYRRPQLRADDRRAHHRAQMLVVGHPLRLHILYPRAVT